MQVVSYPLAIYNDVLYLSEKVHRNLSWQSPHNNRSALFQSGPVPQCSTGINIPAKPAG